MEDNQTAVTEPTNSGVDTAPTIQTEEQKAVVEPTTKGTKTFTQEEVDNIIKERLDRERKKDVNADLEKQVQELTSKLVAQEHKTELSNQNVQDKFKGFVEFEVSKMVNDKKDFKTALSEYLKGDGAEFVAQESKPTPPPRPNNMNTQDANLEYFKKKYPNRF